MARENRSPVWDEYADLPIARQNPTKAGGVLLYRVWCCHEAGDKTDGHNSSQCLRVKKRPPEDTRRPTCTRHRRKTMSLAGNVFRMPDGQVVRFRS